MNPNSLDNQPAPENQAGSQAQTELDADRRKFLASCGKFAAVTPPALTILLSTSLNSDAIARSAGGGAGAPGLPPWLKKLLDELFG